MSKDLSEFHDLLLPELAGCTVPMLNLQLVQAAREFCSKTSAWTAAFGLLDTVAAQASYDLEPPETQSEVVRLTRLSIAGVLQWADTDSDQKGTTAAEPVYERNDPPFELSGELRTITLMVDLVPTAGAVGALAVTGAMKPRHGATRLPDFLLNQYSDAIRYGTLSRLMVMARKPWSNLALSGIYMAEWNRALNFAAYQAQTGNTREHLRTKKW